MPFLVPFRKKGYTSLSKSDISILYRVDISSFMATNAEKQISHLSNFAANSLTDIRNKLAEKGFAIPSSIFFAHHYSGYVFFPFPLDDYQQQKLLNQSFDIQDNTLIFRDYLAEDLFLYHFLPQTIGDELNTIFGIQQPQHFISILLKYLLAQSLPDRTYWCHRQPNNRLDIIVLEQGKLIFCNSFDLHLPTDVLYYTLAVYGVTNGNIARDTLYLIGKFESGDVFYQQLRPYFKVMKFWNDIEGFELVPADDSFFKHEFVDLITTRLCG